tara:strand:- start:2180 stop:2737 length:558 start_codon:yes stop_codon:yes gene_type:complete
MIPTTGAKGRGQMAAVERYPLSDADLRRVLGRDLAIHNYPQLEHMDSIDELFDAKGRCIMLYPNVSPTSGHWVCLMRRPDRIDYQDSYGEAPEGAKRGMGMERREELDIAHPDLTRLLKSSGLPVFYSRVKFQAEGSGTATCGRHAAVRLLYAPYSLEKYKKTVDSSGLTPDEFVCGVIFDRLKK